MLGDRGLLRRPSGDVDVADETLSIGRQSMTLVLGTPRSEVAGEERLRRFAKYIYKVISRFIDQLADGNT
jgi:hypothetical protein